jgi:hypothetical protein
MALANEKLIPTQKQCANFLASTRPNGWNSPTTFSSVQGLADGICGHTVA